MKLEFSEDAIKQLDNLYTLYLSKSEQAAAKIYNDIIDDIERLLIFPQMAQVEPILSEEPLLFRALVSGKHFKVIYFIEDEAIHITDIWDCRMNPSKLLKGFKKIRKK